METSEIEDGFNGDVKRPANLELNPKSPSVVSMTSLDIDECGLPLSIFTKASCHDYYVIKAYELLNLP